jgi:hypothetical protein
MFTMNSHKFHALFSTRLSHFGYTITSFANDGFWKCLWARTKYRKCFGSDILEQYHKEGDEYLNHIVRISNSWWNLAFICEFWNQRAVKAVDKHIYQIGWKSLNKRLPESWWQLFSVTGKECWWWNSCNKGPQQHQSVLRKTEKLHRAIQNKKRGMLTSSTVLLHDNACLRKSTAARTWALLEHLNWELPDLLFAALTSLWATTICLATWRIGLEHNASIIMSWWKVSKCDWPLRWQASLTQTHKNLFSDKISVSIPAMTILRSSLSTYIFFVQFYFFHCLFC